MDLSQRALAGDGYSVFRPLLQVFLSTDPATLKELTFPGFLCDDREFVHERDLRTDSA